MEEEEEEEEEDRASVEDDEEEEEQEEEDGDEEEEVCAHLPFLFQLIGSASVPANLFFFNVAQIEVYLVR
jgi:hypothetical protein